MGCWRADGAIFDANESLLELLGCTRAEIDAGHVSWRDMTPPEYAALDARALKQIQEFGECVPFEKEYIRGDGARVAVLVGGASFGRDITNAGCFFAINLSSSKALHLAGTIGPVGEQNIRDGVLRLTRREREIAELLASGQSCKQIARALKIATKTVDNHRTTILHKMAADNPTQLAHMLAMLR